MTEIEKLRALLAEAREGLFDEDVFHDVPRCPCRFCNLARRIDAALAEPVANWQQLHEQLSQMSAAGLAELERERDEARAEVERLKAQVKALLNQSAYLAGFTAGAEAMREAAARTYWQMAPAIRALPIPEDKS